MNERASYSLQLAKRTANELTSHPTALKIVAKFGSKSQNGYHIRMQTICGKKRPHASNLMVSRRIRHAVTVDGKSKIVVFACVNTILQTSLALKIAIIYRNGS